MEGSANDRPQTLNHTISETIMAPKGFKGILVPICKQFQTSWILALGEKYTLMIIVCEIS